MENGLLVRPVMTADLQDGFKASQNSENSLEEFVQGSRRLSNYIAGIAVSIGGIGFLLAAFSSYFGLDLIPIGHPSTLIFVPQGLIMGLYGVAAGFLSIYLWVLISIDFGAGINRFDKTSGLVFITRRSLLKTIEVKIPIKDVKAVKLDVKEGINPRRRITLRIQSRRDLPLTGAGSPLELVELEKKGAEIARFLGVNLEGA